MADKKPTNSLLTGNIMIHVYYMCMCVQLPACLYMRHMGTVRMKVRRYSLGNGGTGSCDLIDSSWSPA